MSDSIVCPGLCSICAAPADKVCPNVAAKEAARSTEQGFGAWHVDGYLVAARSCAEAVGQLIVSEGLSSESIDLRDIRQIDDIDTTTLRVEDSEKGGEWHDVPVRELIRNLAGPEIIAWPQD